MPFLTFLVFLLPFFTSILAQPTVEIVGTSTPGETLQYDSKRDQYILSDRDNGRIILLNPDMEVIDPDFAAIRGNPGALTVVKDVFYVILRDRVSNTFAGIGKYSLITGEELAYVDLDPIEEPNDPCYDTKRDLLFVTDPGIDFPGNVYTGRENLWIFDKNLNLVRELGTQALIDAGDVHPNGCIVVDDTVLMAQNVLVGEDAGQNTAIAEYDIKSGVLSVSSSLPECIRGDGLIVDRCGNLWLACNGASLIKYNPEGTLDWYLITELQYQDIGYDNMRNRILGAIAFGANARSEVLQISDPECPEDEKSEDSDESTSEEREEREEEGEENRGRGERWHWRNRGERGEEHERGEEERNEENERNERGERNSRDRRRRQR